MEQQALVERIERLERANRVLGTSLVAVVAMCVAVGFSQKPDEIQDVVKARALQIYSADGKVIVGMGYNTWSEGGGITIYDRNGERRSWWRANIGGAHLMMVGRKKSSEGELEDHEASAVMAVRDDSANVSLYGTDTLGWMIVDGDKDPTLDLFGKGDKTVFTTRKKN